MSYQVLARKWRPQTFADVVGQEHVLTALANGLSLGRIHHAYLFSGTRGVGKTSIARLLAKGLNCETGITATPCGVCDNCREIEQGRFVDLIEIDAASRTKVEDTRDQQIAKFVESGLGRMMVNAGSSESYGAEVSLTASVNRNLSLNGSYGYTHSTFKKYDAGKSSSDENIDYSGHYVPFVPRHTMNAGVNYSFFFNENNWAQSLTVGLNYTGAGKIYWTEKNDVSQSFYGTLNGRISLQAKALQIDFWGRNLTNKDYTTFYFESMARGFEQRSKPLQFGVDVRYHF